MIGFAYGVHLLNTQTAAWLLGLKVAAVAVVAQAIWLMGRKLCPDAPRLALMAAGAAMLMFFHAAWLQPAVIATGALIGLACLRSETHTYKGGDLFSPKQFLPPGMAAFSLATFALMLGICLGWHGAVSSRTPSRDSTEPARSSSAEGMWSCRCCRRRR